MHQLKMVCVINLVTSVWPWHFIRLYIPLLCFTQFQHTCISCNLERYIIDGVQNFLSWIGFLYYTDFLINYRILRKARLFIRQLIMDIPIIFNCYHVSISKRNSDRNINKFKFTSLEAPIHY